MYLCPMKQNKELQVGMTVKVIKDTLTAIIARINGDKVTVESEDGFFYDFDRSELIPVKDWEPHLDSTKDLLQLAGESHVQGSGTQKKEKNPEAHREIDLHIHELTDSEAGMSSHDKLQLQLNTAKRELELALQEKRSRLIFIHGRGEGKLKIELKRLLDQYPAEHWDASYLKYGLGATEVRLYQKGSDPDNAL